MSSAPGRSLSWKWYSPSARYASGVDSSSASAARARWSERSGCPARALATATVASTRASAARTTGSELGELLHSREDRLDLRQRALPRAGLRGERDQLERRSGRLRVRAEERMDLLHRPGEIVLDQSRGDALDLRAHLRWDGSFHRGGERRRLRPGIRHDDRQAPDRHRGPRPAPPRRAAGPRRDAPCWRRRPPRR